MLGTGFRIPYGFDQPASDPQPAGGLLGLIQQVIQQQGWQQQIAPDALVTAASERNADANGGRSGGVLAPILATQAGQYEAARAGQSVTEGEQTFPPEPFPESASVRPGRPYGAWNPISAPLVGSTNSAGPPTDVQPLSSSLFPGSSRAETRSGDQSRSRLPQIAQALPPVLFGRLPPIFPRTLAPLKQLPEGSRAGPGVGKPFPRSFGQEEEKPPPCAYCGNPTTRKPGPRQFHRDHNIPKSRGGDNTRENYLPSCRSCNLQKRDRTPEEWYDWIEDGGV